MRRPRPSPDPTRRPAQELTGVIGEVGAQGDGRLEPSGAHVPFTLAGEEVRASVGDGRGELLELLRPSPQRVEPPCPHFGTCGGCALQHWELGPYRAWKLAQLEALLQRAGLDAPATLGFAAEPGTRRRVALHARRGTREAAQIGYKGRRSWSLVPVSACPIADPRLVAAFPALACLAAPLFENAKSAPTLHVTLTDTGIDVDISGVERRSGGLSADARVRVAKAAAEADFARVTLDGEGLYQVREAVVRFGAAAVALPPGGFLQAVAAAEEAMGRLAMQACAGASRIADLYCGAGAFTLRLAQIAPVLAADVSEGAIGALKSATGSTPGLKGIAAQARDLSRRPVLAAELKGIDAVVFDPPRAGALEQAGEIARSGAGVAVAVSCNPTTFVRDATVLGEHGFRLQAVTAVDQFLWSPHIELVGVFTR